MRGWYAFAWGWRCADWAMETTATSAAGVLPAAEVNVIDTDRLELRALLSTGSLAGRVFRDDNGNATQDGSDPGLSGVTVFLDANANGELDPASIVTRTNSTARTIGNPGLANSDFTVSGVASVIADLNVSVNFTHGRDDNLDVFLISPAGTRIELFTDVGGAGANINTTLDDEANTSIVNGSAPFTGTFRPEGLLSAVDGQSPNGLWRLEMTDDTNDAFSGRVNSWSLRFTLNDAELSTSTGTTGDYSFSNVTTGTYDLIATPPSALVATSPTGGARPVTVEAGVGLSNLNFALRFPDPDVAVAVDGQSLVSGQSTIVDFGQAARGANVVKTFTLTNTGVNPVILDSITTPDGFTLLTDVANGTSVAAGGSLTLDVQLNTASIGAASGTLRVLSNDPDESPFLIELAGETLDPEVRVLVDSVDFATGQTLSLGSTSTGVPIIRQVQIRNIGTASLTVAIAGAAPTGVSFAPSFTGTATIAPNGVVTIDVTVNAAAAGDIGGALVLTTNDFDESTFTLNLAGSVSAPGTSLSVVPTGGSTRSVSSGNTVNLGNITIGTTQTVSVVAGNGGPGSLILQPASLTGASFSMGTNFNANQVVAAGDQATLTFSISSNTLGPVSGVLSFATNDPSIGTAQITFEAVISPPVVPEIRVVEGTGAELLHSASVDLGSAIQGAPRDAAFTVTNDGTANLVLQSVTLAGEGLSLTNPPAANTVVAPGDSISFGVRMTAVDGGPVTGSLSIESNDGDEATLSFSLAGDVLAPEIQVLNGLIDVPTSGGIDLGSFVQGETSERTIRIRNAGTAPLALQPALVSNGAFVLVNPIPSGTTLEAGEFYDLTIRQSGAARGVQTANLTIPSNDSDEPSFVIALTGETLAPRIQVTVDSEEYSSEQTLTLGTTSTGMPRTKTVRIRNAGDSNLTVSFGAPPTGYAFGPAFEGTATVEPNGETTIDVTLLATAAGDIVGALVLTTNDLDQATFTLNLAGEVQAPSIEVSVTLDGGSSTTAAPGSTIDLGDVTIDVTRSATLSVGNGGPGTLILQPASVSGTGFSLASNVSANQQVSPEEIASLRLDFTSNTLGPVSGTLSFVTNDPSLGTVQFTFTAVVVPAVVPDISVSAAGSGTDLPNLATIQLGSTIQGTTLVTTATIRNIGTANLVIGSISVAGDGIVLVTPFAANTVIAGGGSIDVNVRLTGVDAGPVLGAMVIESSDADEPELTFVLSGQVLAPKVELRSDNAALAPDDMLVFDPIVQGQTTDRTVQIRNGGDAPLLLQRATISNAAFRLLSVIPAGMSLAPGDVFDLSIRQTGIFSGERFADLVLPSNDVNMPMFRLTLRSNVAPTTFTSQIIDDGEAGFSAPGWIRASGRRVGVSDDFVYRPTGTGAFTARWTFSTIPPGRYRVSATWLQAARRATNSQFVIRTDASPGAAVLGAATIDQTAAPSGPLFQGVRWTNLSDVGVAGNSLVVELTDRGDGFAIADAIRLERLGELEVWPTISLSEESAPVANGSTLTWPDTLRSLPVQRAFTLTNLGAESLLLSSISLVGAGFRMVGASLDGFELLAGQSVPLVLELEAVQPGQATASLSIATNDPNTPLYSLSLTGFVAASSPARWIDDNDVGFSTTGFWSRSSGPGVGAGNDMLYATNSGGVKTARWTAVSLEPGRYRIGATWAPAARRATNARFSAYDASLFPGSVLTTTVNQGATRPRDFVERGVGFALLGEIEVPSGTAVVELTNQGANGFVIADAVYFQRIGPLSTPPNGILATSAKADGDESSTVDPAEASSVPPWMTVFFAATSNRLEWNSPTTETATASISLLESTAVAAVDPLDLSQVWDDPLAESAVER